jgi:hypothetical protein
MFRWELDGLAQQQLGSLPPHVSVTLAVFMNAVVLVDPIEYQHDEPGAPKDVRTLYFGPHGEGLVMFLGTRPTTWCWSSGSSGSASEARKNAELADAAAF